MAKIYVASSWRNNFQQIVVEQLRKAGHGVYDFKNPTKDDHGFHWSQIDENWQNWNPSEYCNGLNHQLAENGFKSGMNAMEWADIFIGVQPFGRSASMEMGWASGKGKSTALFLDTGEPELMVKMFDFMHWDLNQIIQWIKTIDKKCDHYFKQITHENCMGQEHTYYRCTKCFKSKEKVYDEMIQSSNKQ